MFYNNKIKEVEDNIKFELTSGDKVYNSLFTRNFLRGVFLCAHLFGKDIDTVKLGEDLSEVYASNKIYKMYGMKLKAENERYTSKDKLYTKKRIGELVKPGISDTKTINEEFIEENINELLSQDKKLQNYGKLILKIIQMRMESLLCQCQK
ncbi:MAG: hypothetical protein N4A47_04095 [Clostridia bacterium]|jgi:hypothetical protein|nr:hypothetical protein [Clostridia bacterium]